MATALSRLINFNKLLMDIFIFAKDFFKIVRAAGLLFTADNILSYNME